MDPAARPPESTSGDRRRRKMIGIFVRRTRKHGIFVGRSRKHEFHTAVDERRVRLRNHGPHTFRTRTWSFAARSTIVTRKVDRRPARRAVGDRDAQRRRRRVWTAAKSRHRTKSIVSCVASIGVEINETIRTRIRRASGGRVLREAPASVGTFDNAAGLRNRQPSCVFATVLLPILSECCQ